MPLDPQTAMMLARMLQGQIGTTPSPDLLGSFYQSNAPGTSLDDAMSSARSYLSNQGQVPQPPPGPQPTGFETPPAAPGQGGGGGNPGPGATGFGAPANLGQASAQATSGPIGASLGSLGSAGLNAALNATLTGSLASSNPIVGIMMAALNQAGKYGAQSEGIPGLESMGLTIGDVNQYGMLGDPISSQFLDPSIATTLAAQNVSSAPGRGPSFGIEGISATGGRGQGAAGGGGLTGVEGVPGAIGPQLEVEDSASGPGAGQGGASSAGPGPAGGEGPGVGGTGASSGFRRGGYVPGTGTGDTVPALLEPGEFVVTKQAAKKHGGALSRINKEKGLRAPIESLDDLLTRARAHFDVSGTAGPGLPTMRGPR